MRNRIVGYVLASVPSGLRERIRRLPLIGELLHRLSHALSPTGTRRPARIRSGPARGLRMRLDLRYEQALRDGTHEPELSARIEQVIRPGDVVYDVGANAGYYTLAAARLVGANGRVYAFEPDQRNIEALRENVRSNGLANVDIVEKAVWSTSGTVGFQLDHEHVGRGEGHVSVGSGDHVPAVTLDEFSAEARPPTLIKIDAEGAEGHILTGARRLLESGTPTVVLELHDARDVDTLAILEACGYLVEDLAPGRSPRHFLATPHHRHGARSA